MAVQVREDQETTEAVMVVAEVVEQQGQGVVEEEEAEAEGADVVVVLEAIEAEADPTRWQGIVPYAEPKLRVVSTAEKRQAFSVFGSRWESLLMIPVKRMAR